MCPFRKALPLALFLHLMLVIGIVGLSAQHPQALRRVFTRVPLARGQGLQLSPGAAEPVWDPSRIEALPAPQPVVDFAPVSPVALLAPALSTAGRALASWASEASALPSASLSSGVAVPSAGQVAASGGQGPTVAGADIDTSGLTGGTLTPPVALRKPHPRVPFAHRGGQVVLQFTISSQGIVEDVCVEESPSPFVTAAVLSILPHWRFAPAQQEGRAVALRVRQVVKF